MSNNIINIPKNTRFGLEIEMEDVDYNEVERLMKHIDEEISTKQDQSLIPRSAEIALPVYKNRKDEIERLKKISKTVKHLNPSFHNCSFQVNLDMHLGERNKLDLLKAFAYFEEILYRYSRGNDFLIRESAATYADLLLFDLGFKLRRQGIGNPEICEWYEKNKRFAVALKSDIDVVEFRSPNGTYDFDLWLDYIKTFYYFLDSVRKEKYDIDKIEYWILEQMEKGNEKHSLSYRGFQINEPLVKEFVENTFTNDADKGEFIKKYRKK